MYEHRDQMQRFQLMYENWYYTGFLEVNDVYTTPHEYSQRGICAEVIIRSHTRKCAKALKRPFVYARHCEWRSYDYATKTYGKTERTIRLKMPHRKKLKPLFTTLLLAAQSKTRRYNYPKTGLVYWHDKTNVHFIFNEDVFDLYGEWKKSLLTPESRKILGCPQTYEEWYASTK